MEGRKVEMESRVASGEQGISSRGWKRVSRGKVATCVPAPSGWEKPILTMTNTMTKTMTKMMTKTMTAVMTTLVSCDAAVSCKV